MNKLSLLILMSLGGTMVHAGPYDAWGKFRAVSVNTAAIGVTGNVSDFPLLVRLTDASAATGADVLSEALANGADVRFTTGDGNIALTYEIERWSATAAEIWVNVPNIAGNATTSIRLYWGRAGQTSASNSAAVFDTSRGFQAVWHMHSGGTSDESDATGNGFTLTAGTGNSGANAPANTPSGAIGSARGFNGSQKFFVVLNSFDEPRLNFPEGGPYTISSWVYKNTGNTSNRVVVNKSDVQYSLSQSSTNLAEGCDVGAQWQCVNGPALSNETWHHLTYVRSASGADEGSSFLYVNGELASSTPAAAGTSTRSTAANVHVGADKNGGYPGDETGNTSSRRRWWNGSIDELHMSNSARSADWAKLSYETQKPGTTALMLGAAQDPNDPFAIWSQNRTILLNTSASGANVTNNVLGFPVLVRLGPNEAAIFTQAKAEGADIRFSKSDGIAELSYQIDRWDAAAQRAEIWVKVDTVYGNNSTQSIKMYWGNATAGSQSSGGAVFDTSAGYVSAWHLGNAAGTSARPNVITGRFPATPVSFPAGYSARLGLIGLSDELTGGNNGDSTTFLAINEGTPSDLFNFPAGQFTYTAWIRPTTAGSFPRLISLVSDDAGTDRIFLSFNGGNIIGRVWGTTSHPTNSTTPPVLGDWNHVAMTVNRGASQDTTRLYHNGVEIATSTHNPMNDIQRNYVRIGKDYINTSADETYDGKIDEARMSRVTRSADYMKLSYESQRRAQAFTNIGAYVATAPDAPTNVTATAGNGQVVVTWAAPVDNGGAAITGYTVSASPGSATCAATVALTCTVTGLTNGTPYTFTATATNSGGTSIASAPSAAVTPNVPTAPGAPTGVTAIASGTTGGGQVTVVWSTPANTGGSPITGYTARAVSDTSKACTTTGALNCNITGLTPGTAYTFTVRATNAIGTGDASVPSASVAPTVGIHPGSFTFRVTGGENPYTFQIPATAVASTDKVTLTISDAYGRTVWSKNIRPSATQAREITWSGRTTRGAKASAGMYVVRVSVRSGNTNVNLLEQAVTLKP